MNTLTHVHIHLTPSQWLAVYWVFSAAIGSLPPTRPNSSQFYLWFHSFAQLVAGNLSKFRMPQIPPPPAQTADASNAALATSQQQANQQPAFQAK